MHSPASRQYRQLLLLLGAVLLPSGLFVAVAIRAHRQEQALAVQARLDARTQAARQLGQQLSLTLGELRLRQITAIAAGRSPERNPPVIVAARFVNGILRRESARQTAAPSPAFMTGLLSAEIAEANGRLAEAVVEYRRALALASDTAVMARIRLGLARSLARGGDQLGATAEHRWLLALPFEITDDEGIPFSLYAAERLQRNDEHRAAVAARLVARLNESPPLGRVEAYMLRDLADSLAGVSGLDKLRRDARAHVAASEQLAALESDLPTLLRLRGGARGAQDIAWIPYGDPLWLVSAAPGPGTSDTMVVVVSALELEKSLTADASPFAAHSVRLAAAGAIADAEPLGPTLPGLAALLRMELIDRRTTVALLVPLLVLVVGLTALATYLLWRDVSRESRAAALRSRFVSAVSHELKTPLTSIRMFAEMLRMRPEDGRTRGAFLDTIVGESERLTRLIENVLHFSRMEERRQSYRLVEGDLGKAVREAAQAMTYPIAQEGLHLRVDVDSSVPPVRLDRDALVQAVLNLLSNAVKFSPSGSEISLRLERRNGEALISVRDNGIGIDRQEHALIFEEFYRSPAAEARGIEGTGLGLALVSDVARAHGGRVDVESEPGAGSTFTVRIPIAGVT